MAAEKNQFTGNELPSLLPKQKPFSKAKVKEGHYGPVCDTLRQGFSSVQNDLTYSHPIECSERSIQRLPCLPSSMVALETLLGFDTTIDFDDFLNDPNDSEVARDAHSMMEN